MSPKHLRRGARVAASAIDLAALGAGWVSDVAGTNRLLGLIFVAIVTGTWLLVEVIVGGFEQLEQKTAARYDELHKYQASSEAIVARTVTALTEEGQDAEVVSLRR